MFQRYVTHGLPISRPRLAEAVSLAEHHVERLGCHSSISLADGRFFEFGVGWDLSMAQALCCFGAERQTLVDIRDLVMSLPLGNPGWC